MTEQPLSKKREVEDLSIINQVQNDYPENSKEAIQFAINLTRIRERDNWILILREKEQAIQKTLKELKEIMELYSSGHCEYINKKIDTTFKQNFGSLTE